MLADVLAVAGLRLEVPAAGGAGRSSPRLASFEDQRPAGAVDEPRGGVPGVAELEAEELPAPSKDASPTATKSAAATHRTVLIGRR